MSLADDDSVVRCALWPQFLRKENLVASESILGPVMPYTSEKETFGLSVGAKSLMPTVEAIHDYGCRTASEARANQQAKAEEASMAALSKKELSRYLGFYEVAVGTIRALPSPHFDVDVKEYPEPQKNLPEHCHIELHVRDMGTSKGKRQSNATAFLGIIWEQMRGPQKHLCPEDAADDELREFLEEKQALLPTMPGPTLVEA